MGYYVELNTLLRPPAPFDFNTLAVGNRYTVTLERERAFPLHIAVLLIDADWNFYGYVVAHAATLTNKKTTLDFEVLTLFSKEEQNIYKMRFIEAAKKTGEVK